MKTVAVNGKQKVKKYYYYNNFIDFKFLMKYKNIYSIVGAAGTQMSVLFEDVVTYQKGKKIQAASEI